MIYNLCSSTKDFSVFSSSPRAFILAVLPASMDCTFEELKSSFLFILDIESANALLPFPVLLAICFFPFKLKNVVYVLNKVIFYRATFLMSMKKFGRTA